LKGYGAVDFPRTVDIGRRDPFYGCMEKIDGLAMINAHDQ